MYIDIYWKLLSNQNIKGPYMYLEAEVVEEIIEWLGRVGPQLPTKYM